MIREGDDVIPNWILQRAMTSPKRTALRFEGESWTYEQLQTMSEKKAKQLIALDIQPGSRVAIYASSTPAIIWMMAACMQLRCEMVLLNLRLSKAEVAYQMTDAAVEAVLVEDELLQRLPNTDVAVHTFSTIERMTPQHATFEKEWQEDQTVTIMYTSGTTGFPKGVRQTVKNHVCVATSSLYNTGLVEQDSWICTVPLFHISGFSMFVKCLLHGVRLDLYRKFDEEAVCDQLIEGSAVRMSVVAVTLQRILSELEKRGQRVSPKFLTMLVGGGPVPESYLKRAIDCGIQISQTYGMTETSSQTVTLASEDALRKLGSAGKPLFFNQLRIDGAQQPREIGEICIKSDQVTPGYVGRFEGKSSTVEGWLHTGDLGYVDEEGYLFVVDRRSDLIISGGENIYPAEIENVLASHADIQEVGVCGVTSDEWGQVPAAFIVPKETIDCEEVKQFCAERLARYKVPKHFYIVEKLPRNGSKKLMRRKLNDLL